MTETGVVPARWLPGWFVSTRGFRESVGLSLLSGGAELGGSILANLAVPLVASTAAYAGYRTIALYSLFVGALHFGLATGSISKLLGNPWRRWTPKSSGGSWALSPCCRSRSSPCWVSSSH